MSADQNALEKAIALLRVRPSGDDRVLFPGEDDAAAHGGCADRFAGFEGRFDEFAQSDGVWAEEAAPAE